MKTRKELAQAVMEAAQRADYGGKSFALPLVNMRGVVFSRTESGRMRYEGREAQGSLTRISRKCAQVVLERDAARMTLQTALRWLKGMEAA